jgi:hypothetical protein
VDLGQELETWSAWLGSEPKGRTIFAEIVEMLAFRQIWRGFSIVHDAAPEEARENATFVFWIRWNYARSMGSAIRRQVDVREDVVSLGRLIDRIWKYPTVLTREHYRRTQGPDDLRMADEAFNKLAGAGEYINPEIPAADMEGLRQSTATVRSWVNKAVAHTDQRERDAPSLAQIDDSIDSVVELFRKYYGLIVGVSVIPSVVMTPWPVVFRVPWIPDDDQLRDVMRRVIEIEQPPETI